MLKRNTIQDLASAIVSGHTFLRKAKKTCAISKASTYTSNMKEAIKDIQDIKLLVDTFHARVVQDELLAPIFHDRIKDMPAHLESMYKFWQGILLDQLVAYDQAPVSKHADLPLMNQHFVRWQSLFLDTIDALYTGPSAELAKVRVISMAEEFQNKLEMLRF